MGAKELNLFDSIKNGDVSQAIKLLAKNSSTIKSKETNQKGSNTYFQTLKSKINVNFQNESGMTCLHQASISGNLELVKLLIDCGAQVDVKDSNGYTPLHYSVQFNKFDLVSLFLQYGINPNDSTYKQDTPLHLAVQFSSEKIILNLLNNGAYFSLASLNQQSLTPFELACDLGKFKIVEIFIKFCTASNTDNKVELIKKFSLKCLNLSAKNGHDDIIRLLLINNIIDLNYSTPEGTALHEACRYGRVQTVKLLLESGIDPNLKNTTNQLAFDVIIKQKIGNDIKCLIKEFSQSVRAISIKSNKSTHAGALNFGINEMLTVLDKSNQNWRGFILDKNSYTTRSGYFPCDCVQLVEDSNIFHTKRSYITSSTNSLLKLNDSDSLTEQSSIYLSQNNLDKISKKQNLSPSSSSLSSSSSSSYSRKNSDNTEIYLKSPVSFKSGQKNVSYLLKMGLTDSQIIFNWLKEFNMECYYENFVKSGYDLITITKCCPADLCAIGISEPAHRQLIKKAINLLDISEIESRLDQYLIKISSLEELLKLIHLEQYLSVLKQLYKSFNEFLNTLSWEDLEDLGIKKLGHQKKLIFISKKIRQLQKCVDNKQESSSTSLTKSLENLNFRNQMDRLKQQPPLPPRVSSIFVPKENSSYATLPRNFNKKILEDKSDSSSSTSPSSISPTNKFFDVNSILVPPTPPPMPLISIPVDETRKSPRRVLKLNGEIKESYNKINSDLKLSSVLNRSREINNVHSSSRFNSNQTLSLPLNTDEGILNDIDSMLCDLNKQLDNMLDYERSFNS